MQDPAYAPEERREVEQAITLALLRCEDGTRWSRAQLEAELGQIEPDAVGDALTRLGGRGVLKIEDDTLEFPGSANRRSTLDALSAVVLHVLVVAHPQTQTLAAVAKECERDLSNPEEREEVELALRWITGDGLATRQEDGWIATRPAVRAAELSF